MAEAEAVGTSVEAAEVAVDAVHAVEEELGEEAEAGAVQAAPLRLASEQALRQAREEGLTLRAGNNSTGYFGVCHDPSRTLPYRAQLKCGGKKVCLGNFATAEEAALCVARSPEGRRAAQEGAAAATAAALTSEEAVRQAQEEGLPLLQASSSNSATGYFGVYVDPRCKSKPYTARVWRAGGRSETLGQFATAEEAALCVARTPEGQAALGRATTFAELTPPPVPEPRLPEVQAEILFPKLDRAEAELRALLAAQDAAASKAAVEASDAETSALRAAQERHIDRWDCSMRISRIFPTYTAGSSHIHPLILSTNPCRSYYLLICLYRSGAT